VPAYPGCPGKEAAKRVYVNLATVVNLALVYSSSTPLLILIPVLCLVAIVGFVFHLYSADLRGSFLVRPNYVYMKL